MGGYHNAALDEAGRLYMWGRGDHIYIKGVISDVPLVSERIAAVDTEAVKPPQQPHKSHVF